VWRTKFNGNQHIFVRLSLDTHQAAVSHLIFKPSNFDYDLPISVGQVGVFISYFRPVSEEIQHIALLKSLQNHHSLPTSTMILWVLSNKIPHNSKTTKTTTPTRISFTYHLFFTSQLIVVQKNININNITSNFRKLKKHGRLLPFHRSGFFSAQVMQFRSWLVGALSFFFLSGVLQGCRQESTTATGLKRHRLTPR
jgi:hypothetical protein